MEPTGARPWYRHRHMQLWIAALVAASPVVGCGGPSNESGDSTQSKPDDSQDVQKAEWTRLKVLPERHVPGPMSQMKQVDIIKCERKANTIEVLVYNEGSADVRFVVDFEANGQLVMSRSGDIAKHSSDPYEISDRELRQVDACRLATAIR